MKIYTKTGDGGDTGLFGGGRVGKDDARVERSIEPVECRYVDHHSATWSEQPAKVAKDPDVVAEMLEDVDHHD